MTYIHELADWPHFRWDQRVIAERLPAIRHRQGRLLGRMENLGFEARSQAALRGFTEDGLRTSEIEGEILDPAQVRSSVARRLGLDIAGLVPADRRVEGLVEMVVDATRNFAERLDAARLWRWHAALFPGGAGGLRPLKVGAWRDDSQGPMQVVSGPIGRERVHFQAPAASRLDAEMARFFDWFESRTSAGAWQRAPWLDPTRLDPVLRSAVAHLWLLTLHPFDDGNGRIARAVADLALARADQSPERFYSLSAQIRVQREAYYRVLEQTQSGDLDISAWLAFYLDCLDGALTRAEATLAGTIRDIDFWTRHAGAKLNDRQRKVLQLLLGPFEGKVTSSKWAKLAKCSQDTAQRDLAELVQLGILLREAPGGRSTHYRLASI